jgi:hypothetical protein
MYCKAATEQAQEALAAMTCWAALRLPVVDSPYVLNEWLFANGSEMFNDQLVSNLLLR